MIRIQVDMAGASPGEVESFFALPSVGAAFDVLTQLHDPELEVRLSTPAPVPRLVDDPDVETSRDH